MGTAIATFWTNTIYIAFIVMVVLGTAELAETGLIASRGMVTFISTSLTNAVFKFRIRTSRATNGTVSVCIISFMGADIVTDGTLTICEVLSGVVMFQKADITESVCIAVLRMTVPTLGARTIIKAVSCDGKFSHPVIFIKIIRSNVIGNQLVVRISSMGFHHKHLRDIIAVYNQSGIHHLIDLNPVLIFIVAAIQRPTCPIKLCIFNNYCQSIRLQNSGAHSGKHFIGRIAFGMVVVPVCARITIHYPSRYFVASIFMLQRQNIGMGAGIGDSGILTAAAGNVKAADIAPDIHFGAFLRAEALRILRGRVNGAVGGMDRRLIGAAVADGLIRHVLGCVTVPGAFTIRAFIVAVVGLHRLHIAAGAVVGMAAGVDGLFAAALPGAAMAAFAGGFHRRRTAAVLMDKAAGGALIGGNIAAALCMVHRAILTGNTFAGSTLAGSHIAAQLGTAHMAAGHFFPAGHIGAAIAAVGMGAVLGCLPALLGMFMGADRTGAALRIAALGRMLGMVGTQIVPGGSKGHHRHILRQHTQAQKSAYELVHAGVYPHSYFLLGRK